MDLFPRNYRRLFFGDTRYNESWTLELTFGHTGMDCLARTSPLAACHLKYWGLITFSLSFFYKCYMYTKVFIQLEIMTVTVNLNSINTNINQETTKSCVNFFGAVNIGWHEGNSRACNLEVNHKRAKTNLNSGNQQKVSLHLQNPVSIRSLAWGAFCCNYQ